MYDSSTLARVVACDPDVRRAAAEEAAAEAETLLRAKQERQDRERRQRIREYLSRVRRMYISSSPSPFLLSGSDKNEIVTKPKKMNSASRSSVKLTKIAMRACAENDAVAEAMDGLIQMSIGAAENGNRRTSLDMNRNIGNGVVIVNEDAVKEFDRLLHQEFIVKAIRAVVNYSSSDDDDDDDDDDNDFEITDNNSSKTMFSDEKKAFVTAKTMELIEHEKRGKKKDEIVEPQFRGKFDPEDAAKYLNDSMEQRKIGSTYFARGKYRQASEAYRCAFHNVQTLTRSVNNENDDSSDSSIYAQALPLLHLHASNLAISLIREKRYEECIEVCNASLKMNSNSQSSKSNNDIHWKNTDISITILKCLYRRGIASMALEQWDIAFNDFSLVLKADPLNNDARKRLQELQIRKRAAKERESKMAKASLKAICPEQE